MAPDGGATAPTQAYDFGWWDGRVITMLARQPGERFYGLGDRAGGWTAPDGASA